MAGFSNDVVFGKNVDFTGTLPVSGQINLDGELLVGASVAPFIRAHVPTGSNGVSIVTGPGTLDFTLANIPSSALQIVDVPHGGTGNSSFTANCVICAGTVATSPFQNVAGVGTAGQILTSNGPGVLPTWQIAPSVGAIIYYLTNTASGVATYLKQLVAPFSPKTDLPFAGIGAGNTVLKNWITDPGIPNLGSIPAGAFILHIHADQTAGSRNVQLYAEIWESSSTGVDIAKIGTTELTPVLGGIEAEYDVTFVTSSPYIMGSTASRITTRIFASGAAVGSNATVHIFVGGTADSHIELPSSTVDVSNFVPYTGAVNDVNLGTHTISAASATLTSALTVPNGGTGVASFANTSALICSGTTTTGTLQNVASVATGQVLVSAGTSTLPAWSATPTVTSITFGGGSALNDYETGSWTPTITGGTSAGSTTYTAQTGLYYKIGNIVTVVCNVGYSAASGTGNLNLGGLPFATNVTAGLFYHGLVLQAGAQTWPASKTTGVWQFGNNTTNGGVFQVYANAQAAANVAIANNNQTWRITMTYLSG